MADKTVTIDAAWFALYAAKRANKTNEPRFDDQPKTIWGVLKATRDERDDLNRQLEMKEEQCKECAALCAAKMQCEDLEKERDELKASPADMTRFRDNCEEQLQKSFDEHSKTITELNELKAKLKDLSKHDAIAISDSRLAAAERCIDDIWNLYTPKEQAKAENKELDLIRAYREANNAKSKDKEFVS